MPKNSNGYPTPGWRLEPRLTWYAGTALWVEEIHCEEHARYEAVVRHHYAEIQETLSDYAKRYPDDSHLNTPGEPRVSAELARAFGRDAKILRALADSGEWPRDPQKALDLLQYEIAFHNGSKTSARRSSSNEPNPTLARLVEASAHFKKPLTVPDLGAGYREFLSKKADAMHALVLELETLEEVWRLQ